MKINILFNFIDDAWGGGNQFLKALKRQFVERGVYENNPEKADVILFNSYPFREEYRFKEIYNLKKQKKILIHRIDGPISKIRGRDSELDRIIYYFNQVFCDGAIYQSNWTKENNFELGMKSNQNEATIINAPDPAIFNSSNKEPFSKDRKIKLIATSWSSNIRKGFDTYKYLDEHLDFSKYEMSFIGNSPVKFKNIRCIKPLKSNELSKGLKQSDIFITASQNDPCSNSLIEALHSGLPAIVLNDGGHPEILGKGGEVFEKAEEVPILINKIVNNYEKYRLNIKLLSLSEITDQYYQFAEMIFNDLISKRYRLKKVNKFNLYRILFQIKQWKMR